MERSSSSSRCGDSDNSEKKKTKKKKKRVLLLPWLAHGHLSPYLELGRRLHRTGRFDVYLCSTPANLASVSHSEEDDGTTTTVELVELELPPRLLPPELHTTKHLPTHLMNDLKATFDLAGPQFKTLLASLRPHLLVYDFLQPWAPRLAADVGIPSVLFLTTGAAATSFLFHYLLSTPFPFPFPPFNSVGDDDDVEELRYYRRLMDRATADGVTDWERMMECVRSTASFVLVRSVGSVESDYLGHLAQLAHKDFVPVGPLLTARPAQPDANAAAAFSEWLDGKEEGSVVFVSFGSEYFMDRDQIHELAHGLELSQVSFVWVVRFSDEDEDPADRLRRALPPGFLGRVEESGRGLVVEGWAPQTLILSHPSTGAFLTHCGWSSVLEAIAAGVYVLAMPMQLDQPLNASFVQHLRLGVEVRKTRRTGHEHDDGPCFLYGRDDVAHAIGKLMLQQKQQQQDEEEEEEEEEESTLTSGRVVRLMASKLREADDDSHFQTNVVDRLCHLISTYHPSKLKLNLEECTSD